MSVITEARNANLADMAALLQAQHELKIDVVAPATAIRSRGGMIHVEGTVAELTEDGVTMAGGVYRPTGMFDEGIAEKLGIPLKYLRTMRAERPDLYDANVNGWLHGTRERWTGTRTEGGLMKPGTMIHPSADADARSFLFRGFASTDPAEPGIARTLLSRSYGITDHLDVLTAAMAGVRDSGIAVNVLSCDLSDRKMYVKIAAADGGLEAPELLAGYRSPFDDARLNQLRGGDPVDFGYGPVERPIVFAGCVISNSETGDGAFAIHRRLLVKICNNGMIVPADVFRAVHLGAKMDDGVVAWSEDTRRKNLALVTAKARDAVQTFLDPVKLQAAVDKLTRDAVHPIEGSVTKAVEAVGKKLMFTESQTAGILDHFVRGGQMTSGGIAQAVTSYAQTVSADAAHDLELKAVPAMEFAASLAPIHVAA